MKLSTTTKVLVTVMLSCIAAVSQAQDKLATLSGGYVFANLEETDANASGWRINGLIELQAEAGDKLSHGFSIGYIRTTAEATILSQDMEYTISSLPFHYAPKYTFGEKSTKGFVKGAFGWHFTDINRVGSPTTNSDNDSGAYLGLAVGGIKEINESVIISLDYEWAYLHNGFYRDGFLNSIQVGIGYRF